MSTTPGSGGTSGQTKQEIERTRREASHIASDAAEAARERGREQFDTAKNRTADRAEEIADAIESTASELDSGNGDNISGYGHSMAEMMRRFAGGLREQDIEDFASELAGFARRSPGSFLAGSVALGFGVSRFLKATSDRPSDEYYRGRGDELYADEDLEEEYWFDEEDELDTTLQPAASPEVSRRTGDEPWPEDRGNERPGAASSTRHTAPGAGTSSGSTSGTGASTATSTGVTGSGPGTGSSAGVGTSSGLGSNADGSSEYRAGATGAPAAKDQNVTGGAERRNESDEQSGRM